MGGDELVAVYSADGDVVGSATRRRMRAEDLWHAASAILVRSGDRVYVHRRTDDKDVFPGMHDCWAGGVVAAGETPWDCAERELAEELGITGAPLVPLFTASADVEGTRIHLYAYEAWWDGEIVTQESEIASGGWMGLPPADSAVATTWRYASGSVLRQYVAVHSADAVVEAIRTALDCGTFTADGQRYEIDTVATPTTPTTLPGVDAQHTWCATNPRRSTCTLALRSGGRAQRRECGGLDSRPCPGRHRPAGPGGCRETDQLERLIVGMRPRPAVLSPVSAIEFAAEELRYRDPAVRHERPRRVRQPHPAQSGRAAVLGAPSGWTSSAARSTAVNAAADGSGLRWVVVVVVVVALGRVGLGGTFVTEEGSS